MASRLEIENNAVADERAPLLVPQPSEESSTVHPDDEVPLSKDEQKRERVRRRWRYAWRGLWIIVVILVLAVFVKGWIDSDNVEVCDSKLLLVDSDLTLCAV